ncbi:hypothetical protein [Spirosoma aerophilum]
MLYSKVWVKGSLLSLVTFVVGWLLLEWVSGIILHWKDSAQKPAATATEKKGGHSPSPATNTLTLVRNENLGIVRPAPGQYETAYPVKETGLEKIKPGPMDKAVSIMYHIDSLSRRVTPFDSRRAVGKYALFLGCSFTYGESVADSSTLPYFFGKQTGYRPYNYGVSGFSPAHMLALQQSVNMRKEVAEKTGIAIYTYIEDHLARVAPSTKWVSNSRGFWPYVNPATLTVESTYAQKHPVLVKLIQGMYKSNIINLFKINFPRFYSDGQYQRFVSIVKKSEELYRQQFGNDNFYVVIFPAYPMAPELRKAFEQAQLKVVDYSTLFSWKAAYDGMHPNADSYKQVAEKLAEDLPVKPGQKDAAL